MITLLVDVAIFSTISFLYFCVILLNVIYLLLLYILDSINNEVPNQGQSLAIALTNQV